MRPAGRDTQHGAFTLVELLIVILIIGTLAAVAIPQFGSSSTDAKVAALEQNLATVRKAIDKYYYEHNNQYPGLVVAVHKADLFAVAVAHIDIVDAFSKQLTYYSDANGRTSAAKSAAHPYGPYLRKMPANPLPADGATSRASVVRAVSDTTPLRADANATTGWKASSETGQFIANNTEYADR
jgi:prepilin-type N-terminal cleavage/methylation domain-containing protein